MTTTSKMRGLSPLPEGEPAPLIYLDEHDIDTFVRIFMKYAGKFSQLGERKVVCFGVYRQTVGGKLNLVYKERKEGILDIIGASEVNALLRDVKPIPLNIDCRVKLQKDTPIMLKTCKDKITQNWLTSRSKGKSGLSKGTNLDLLVGTFFAGTYMLSYMTAGLCIQFQNGVQFYKTLPDFEKLACEALDAQLNIYRSKHLLDGWDTVQLTKKQFDKLRDVMPEINDGKFETDHDIMPLPQFCLSLYMDGTTFLYYYRLFEDGLMVICDTVEQDIKWCFGAKFNGSIDNIEYLLDDKDEKKRAVQEAWLNAKTAEDAPMTNAQWIVSTFFALNTFMLHYGDIAMEVEEKTVAEPSGAGKKHEVGCRHRGEVRLFKSYKLRRNWKGEYNRKKAEITCPAWGVRGHFRQYRTGKRTFIQPYVKGPEKDKYQGKDYHLFPYSDA